MQKPIVKPMEHYTTILLGATFSRVVELMLGLQIKTCVDSLGSGGAGDLGPCLAVVTSLALEGNNLCRLLVHHGAVDSLLHLCSGLQSPLEVRVAALRALGSICCVLEGIVR